ncbi:hypothetical protein K461DRAFT_272635 [Myriangium duriaei CBS 260.36]|uniref:Ams2/SPT21 N-terminal domain-containing protein n=1 Tax=Myriangium duriaei CBS 260.36 TaxID=1168546 RepID=A0A9P4MNV4_9PEZI|nr:hypothetical protein K461DRAFT_272635 [Myriangium duriaei CBS 260.36]
MSSPAPYHSDVDATSSGNPFDIPSRPMRVKVLYTFDNDNQTNCLARFPDVLKIPTIPIDDVTQIGLIELRQCIRAIVAASPELVARLSQGDFTIYAFDYSEYETPLVGQGMLSTILAANSPTPTAPAHQSKTMITGRVCKNIMGLFSNGVSETLEVKLRLVPVPKPVQSEYVRNMELYRNMSPAMSGGFDPNTWSESLNDDGVVANLEQQSHNFTIPGMEQSLNGQFQHHRQMSNASMAGRPTGLSRRGTQVSRPSSRASVRSVRSDQQSRQRHEPIPTTMESFGEDGPARKRAKITQTDWRGKTTFGGSADSLRVTASTAASIRVHKPVATRPNILAGNTLEPPPRAPTPVPHSQDPNRLRPKGQQASFLRRESSLYQAQTPQSQFDIQSDAVMSSPEDMADQMGEASPLEFPSSPPAMPEPSSPGLPALPRPLDSGYMSGGPLEYLQDDEDRSVEREDRNVVVKSRARPSTQTRADMFIEQTPGPPELLPTRMNMSKHAAQQKERSNSLALPPRPSLSTQQTSSSESAGSGTFPFQLDPHGLLDQSSLFRAPSVAPPRDAACSPAPSDDLAFGGKPRSGSGAKRKKVIQDKLLKSLASGDMPTYCHNCGAIETPTWRSLYIKTVDGAPSEEDYQELEGETRGVEILEREESTQDVTKYRIIKSVRKSKDKDRNDMLDFNPIQVCNPCGLWFNKLKYMRPEEKWSKGPKVARKRPCKKDDLQSDMIEPASDFPHSDFPQSDFPQSDFPQSGLWTDQIQPEDTAAPEPQVKASSEEAADQPQPEPEPRAVMRPRANSMQPPNPSNHRGAEWSSAELDAALQRAIQSSPARFLGTQESPIELEDDLTPRPTRRLLFPSPRKDGEMKSLDDSSLPKGKAARALPDPFINMAYTADKENLPPLPAIDDDLAHLFDCSPFKTPSKSHISTPPSKSAAFDPLLTPSRRPAAQQHRTPSRGMDAFLPSFSSAEKKDLLSTPSRYMNLALTSPARSVSGPMTPFTRHLSQLLSDPSAPALDFSDFPMPSGLGLWSPGMGMGLGLDGREGDFGSPLRGSSGR